MYYIFQLNAESSSIWVSLTLGLATEVMALSHHLLMKNLPPLKLHLNLLVFNSSIWGWLSCFIVCSKICWCVIYAGKIHVFKSETLLYHVSFCLQLIFITEDRTADIIANYEDISLTFMPSLALLIHTHMQHKTSVITQKAILKEGVTRKQNTPNFLKN